MGPYSYKYGMDMGSLTLPYPRRQLWVTPGKPVNIADTPRIVSTVAIVQYVLTTHRIYSDMMDKS